MESELTKEQRLELAVKAVRERSVPSVRQASYLFNVNRNTIHNRLKGKWTAKELQQARQRLSIQEGESIKLREACFSGACSETKERQRGED
jgi:helix-turn-helix, Psq domain